VTTSAELKRAKRAVRISVLAARDAMSASERDRATARIVDHVLSMPEVDSASTVMTFWSFGSEPDTAPLVAALDLRGVRVALPRIVGEHMDACAYAPGDAVTVTPFGASEPSTGEGLDPSTIDIVITPAVAFDRSGRRVGYGGGFYDRFLPRTRPDTLRVGIGFDLQLVEEDLPSGHFDLGLDAIVTESGVLRVRRLVG
jgi:5-formyltetrahydrofolate cyclo-ligase